MPFRVIADRNEAPQHGIQSAMAKVGDVFDDDEFRSEFVDEAKAIKPQVGLFAVDAGFIPGGADVCAGESGGNNIGESDAVIDESLCI